MSELSGPHWELLDDRETLIVSFPTKPIESQLRCDASEFDRLITGLGELRSCMAQQHPNDFALGQKVTAINDPRWFTELDALGEFSLIHFRHPGYGWLSFALPLPEAAKLAQFLQKQAEAPLGQPQTPPH